jgi:hypothetical protein
MDVREYALVKQLADFSMGKRALKLALERYIPGSSYELVVLHGVVCIRAPQSDL